MLICFLLFCVFYFLRAWVSSPAQRGVSIAAFVVFTLLLILVVLGVFGYAVHPLLR